MNISLQNQIWINLKYSKNGLITIISVNRFHQSRMGILSKNTTCILCNTRWKYLRGIGLVQWMLPVVLRRKRRKSILNRLLLKTYFHCLLSIMFVTFVLWNGLYPLQLLVHETTICSLTLNETVKHYVRQESDLYTYVDSFKIALRYVLETEIHALKKGYMSQI